MTALPVLAFVLAASTAGAATDDPTETVTPVPTATETCVGGTCTPSCSPPGSGGGGGGAATYTFTPCPSHNPCAAATIWVSDFPYAFLASWTSQDLDTGSGLDSWGPDPYERKFGAYSLWCATYGNNSFSGNVPNFSIHTADIQMDTVATTSAFGSLSGSSSVLLEFWYWVETDPQDTLSVEALVGGAWTPFWGPVSGDFQYWRRAYNVPVPSGMTAMRFRYTAPSATAHYGVRVDGITLYTNACPSETPTITETGTPSPTPSWTFIPAPPCTPENDCLGNGGFENGSLSGWTTTLSGPSSGPDAPYALPVTNAAAWMPCGFFPAVKCGSNAAELWSGRQVGRASARLERTFSVPSGTCCLRLDYAGVMEGAHSVADDAYTNFTVSVTGGGCTPVAIYSQDHHPQSGWGAQQGSSGTGCSSYWYLPWQTLYFNLCGYVGCQVTLQATAYGCQWGAHGSWAYVDNVECATCPSPTRTATPSATCTATRSGTATRTATRSASATETATRTRSATESATGSASASGTSSASATDTPSATGTATSSATASATCTRTATPTEPPTETYTATSSGTRTSSGTVSATRSASPTVTPSPSCTATQTFYAGAEVYCPEPNLIGPAGATRAIARVHLMRDGRITGVVVNRQGQVVRRLCDDRRAAGWHEVLWDGTSFGRHAAPSGVYDLRITTSETFRACRLVVQR